MTCSLTSSQIQTIALTLWDRWCVTFKIRENTVVVVVVFQLAYVCMYVVLIAKLITAAVCSPSVQESVEEGAMTI